MTTSYVSFPLSTIHVDDWKVIGGGTAGNTIAARLALDLAGYSVAVIETGSFYELDNSNRTTVAGYDYYSVQTDTPPSFVNYNIPTVPQSVSCHCRYISRPNKQRDTTIGQLSMHKAGRLVEGMSTDPMQLSQDGDLVQLRSQLHGLSSVSQLPPYKDSNLTRPDPR